VRQTHSLFSILLFFCAAITGHSQGQSSERLSIRLICKLDYTLDRENRERSEASGEELLAVSYALDGRAVLELQDLGADLLGTVTDDEIAGRTEYFVRGIHVRQEILIDRRTGSYRRTVAVADGAGLFHFGDCREI
jgi:hypothetical protein